LSIALHATRVCVGAPIFHVRVRAFCRDLFGEVNVTIVLVRETPLLFLKDLLVTCDKQMQGMKTGCKQSSMKKVCISVENLRTARSTVDVRSQGLNILVVFVKALLQK
jgi:hypothetical protein